MPTSMAATSPSASRWKDGRCGSQCRERERAQELAIMLEAVPTPVIIVHDPDGLHMTGNRAADDLTRVTPGTEISLSSEMWRGRTTSRP